MAQTENSLVKQTTTTDVAAAQSSDAENLPSLFGRLGEDVMMLVDTKLSLLKVEVKEDVSSYIRDGVFIGLGATVALVGFALFNVALAFLISKLFSFTDMRLNYALGFLVAGILYLVIGGIVVMVAKNRLTSHNPLPEQSIDEIKKDKKWLKNEI